MTHHDPAHDGLDAQDPTARMDTAVRGQHLAIDGWFASHADSGTPGPHVRLHASDGQDPVLRTDQVPALAEALSVVAERIDRMWEVDGAEYAQNVVLRSPDPQDPGVMQQRRVDRLRFTQRVADNLPEVMRLLAAATSTDAALTKIAALLDVDEAEVMVRLARFDLLALTQAASERRRRLLAELEG
jgi:hypothetical protein